MTTREDTMTTETYIVIENTPGYLPDSESADFDNYADACEYANQLADELEEQGYATDRSWASGTNHYAIMATRGDTVAPDLGRTIEVVLYES